MTSKSWPWFVPETDEEMIRALAHKLGIHRLTAATLYQRGLHTPQDVQRFLSCSLTDLGDPFSMADAAKAAERLAAAVITKEKVLICGDYDVDGITATALLIRVLQELGVPVEYYIPSRFADGYGLQAISLEQFAAAGGRLVVSVDCGINSFVEMQLACSLGIDLIITDHHTCFTGTRSAFAILNPKQEHCSYPEKQLAGVGVAWTLVRALLITLGLPVDKAYCYLDIVALGTIADVVPLLGENRILVKHGLQCLQEKPLPGLAALARISGVTDNQITARQVAFTLAPRLNAAGRMGEADPAVRMLLAGPETAEAFALELDSLNKQRQDIEKDILTEALTLAKQFAADPALVLWSDGWNPGVIGIVAGRLAAEYKRPVALIAIEEHEGRGSIRTAPGYNVVEALQDCSEHLERFGGHPEAAGFSVATHKLEQFREAFCRAVASQEPEEDVKPVVAEVTLTELDLKLAQELTFLAPFGHGNPEPLFLIKDAEVVAARRVGSRGDHLRLSLRKNSPTVAAIHFGGGKNDFKSGELLEVVACAGVNEWQGKTSLSLQVVDLRVPQPDYTPKIMDLRGQGNREQTIARLSEEMKLMVWVNTKAAKDGLESILRKRAWVTHLGRDADCNGKYDALLLYHIPYERSAFEELLGAIHFNGAPHIILCYGCEEIALNEKIFAATFPLQDTLVMLAQYMKPAQPARLTNTQLRQKPSFPVTNYLLDQVQTVFCELAAVKQTEWPPSPHYLHRSATYSRLMMTLEQFLAYQNFWLSAAEENILTYLKNPGSLTQREEEYCCYDSASAETAN